MRYRSTIAVVVCLCSWLTVLAYRPESASAALPESKQTIDFTNQIQPILSEHCFHCHGPDDNARQAELRLDTREGLLAESESGGVAVVPNKPHESELYRRITAEDEDERMPPVDSDKKLDPLQIELIKRWIEQGGAWKQHWSFTPPRRPQLPDVNSDAPLRNPIDSFIVNRLQAEGLRPYAQAERETLIRRTVIDLSGLPLSLDQADAYMANGRPDAYERMIDRLLSSKRFGERRAWIWLDAARYGDTNGYQGDRTRTMWPWRNWVIDALNANMPYDKFTVQQLAGDLLPDATLQQKIATGFNRNHPLNGEGGRIPEESRVEYVVDRVETTSTVWLGLTIGCGRCHDHKYDPITQAEFYQLYAFFNNINESGAVDLGGNARPAVKAPVLDKLLELEATNQKIAALQAELDTRMASVSTEAITQWEQQVVAKKDAPPELGSWKYLGPFHADNFNEAHNTKYGPEKAGDASKTFGDLKWTDPNWQDGVIQTIPLRSNSAGYAYREITSAAPANLELNLGADDAIRIWLNGVEILEKVVAANPKPGQARATLQLVAGKNDLLMKISNGISSSGFFFESTHEGIPEQVFGAFQTPPKQRTDEQHDVIRLYYAETAPDMGHLIREKRKLAGQAEVIQKETTVDSMVMREMDKPRDTYLLTRGRYDQPDKSQKLLPGVPASLPSDSDASPNDRLALARWLVNPDHPLTARVTVNRYWQDLFGRGLVKTTEDFGSRGDRPSHPMLLDWLATEYIRLGWDTKSLLRLIVTSATYRQSSMATSEMAQRDSLNRFLARGPRYRLPAHIIRDQALGLSGLLVDKTGGPSVKPYQPDGLWADFSFGKIRYVPDIGEKLYRRTLYTFWRRSVTPPNLFDSSSRDVCSVRPRLTNTPLQALILLNDPTFVEAARVLAERVMHAGGASPDERLGTAFRMATYRTPGRPEMQVLKASLAHAMHHYQANPDAAMKLLAVGQSTADKTLEPIELAAYTNLMNLILNLDEVITKE